MGRREGIQQVEPDRVTPVLLDTHIWSWMFMNNPQLTAIAREGIEDADAVLISSVSLFEIGQEVRLGKWPEMESNLPRLSKLPGDANISVVPLCADVALLAGTLDWSRRDPFDRMIAATAIRQQVRLISADTAFDGLQSVKGWLSRLW